MAISKDWRPENWDALKEQVANGTPVAFSPSTGYSREHKLLLIEASASAIMGALAAVLVTDER